MGSTGPISLVSGWFIEPGCGDAVRAALIELAGAVRAEAGTLSAFSDALSWIERCKPHRAVITTMHSDLDYEVLRQSGGHSGL